MTDPTESGRSTGPAGTGLVAQALSELDVPEHGSSFWADLEMSLETADRPVADSPMRLATEIGRRRRPGVGGYVLAIAAVAALIVIALAALSARQVIVSNDPTDAPTTSEAQNPDGEGTTPTTQKIDLADENSVTTTSPPEADLVAGSPKLPFDIDGVDASEKIADFTITHACCQDRDINIHRIADLVQGVVIRPGETFSLNDHVGQRTEASGFVPGGAINDGQFEMAVGGGVNDYATTLFNAALFAGIDIEERQSMSLYISRYPRGRGASLIWPESDLALTNSSANDIVIWNTYTDESITVAIYSRPLEMQVDVSQPLESNNGECSVVAITRTRTLVGGPPLQDQFVSTYRPGEGLDCDGSPTGD